MSEIRFIDTTLRDGNQSLWALNMKTAAMVEIAEQMDQAGFESMEFFVTNMFKKYVREHKENPWDWLREGTKRLRKTELRLHGGLKGGLEKKPSSILKLIIQKVVDSGITLTRTSNSWNDYDVFGQEVKGLRELGMECVVNLIYSVSPRHTDEYYARKAREAAAIKPYGICFQGRGRPAHSRAHPGAGAHRARQHRRYAGGVPRPLQQRPGAAELPGSHQARHDHHPHQRTAAGQRLGPAFHLQHGAEHPRHGAHGAGGRGGAPAGGGSLHLRGQA